MDVLSSPGKTRLLLLTDEMEVGGTQRQIVHIAAQLDRRLFEPTVLFFRNPSFFVDELKAAGVRVIQVPKQGRLDLRFVMRLKRELELGQFDVMHCFAFSGELWGAFARRMLPRSAQPALISSVRGTYVFALALGHQASRLSTICPGRSQLTRRCPLCLRANGPSWPVHQRGPQRC